MTSTPDREESLFAEALSRPKDQRTAFLEQACSDDDALRQRLTGLLAAHDAPETTLGIPVVQPIIRLDERLGTRIGPYLLLEKIGEGGCGTVFLAEQQEPVRRRVALKVIKLGMDSADVVARFEMERQALALMNHPNIANVLDAGATDTGRPYFVMELVVGTRITAYCDDHKLSLPERLGLFIQVCHAIQHAHQKGIIHRDIKPSNILVTVLDGVPVPKVIDFGIAKATQGQLADRTTLTALAQFIGTPVYMSPEQAELSGCDVDTRSDIYSLGVLLYELITGRPPFDPDSLLRAGLDEIRRHIREVDPPRPSTRLSTLTDADRATIALHRGTDVSRLSTLLRGDLDWIVMRCLEKERARRYDTANGLATDVQRYLNHEPVSASPPSTFYRTRKLVLRHKAFFAAAAVVTLALLAGTVVSTWQAVRATRAERLASARMLSEKTARQDADRQRQLAVDQSALATAARLDAEKQRKLAEERLRSETAARQDSERQKTVAEQERSRAQLAEKVAQAEALISQAVNDFLQKDLLLQADSRVQASAQQTPNPDLTVREALDRASGQVGARFSQQPLVEAGVREAIGQAYQGLGGSDKAAEHFERVLQIRKTELGPDHEHTFNAMHNLGTAYGRIQRLPEAASLLEQTLASRRRLSGPETLATLNTMNSLALVYWAQRRIPEAAALLKPVVEINQRTLGSDHPTSLTAAANLATLYHGLGQAAEAMALLESTLATKEQVLGKEHPDTLNSTNNLGCVYLSSGRPADAARLFTQVAEVRKRVLGPQHPDTLLSMCDLASAFRAQGLLDASAGLLEKTVTAQRQVLKSEHPDTLVSISNLACTYWSQGRRAEATELFAESALTEKRVLTIEHPETLRSMSNLAEAYCAQGRYDEAAPILQETLDTRQRVHGRKHRATFLNAKNLGAVYLRQRNFSAAEDLLLRNCYAGLQDDELVVLLGELRGNEELDLTELLAELYTLWGNSEESFRWRSRHLTLRRQAMGWSAMPMIVDAAMNPERHDRNTYPRSTVGGASTGYNPSSQSPSSQQASNQFNPTSSQSTPPSSPTTTPPSTTNPGTPTAGTSRPGGFRPTPPESSGQRRGAPGSSSGHSSRTAGSTSSSGSSSSRSSGSSWWGGSSSSGHGSGSSSSGSSSGSWSGSSSGSSWSGSTSSGSSSYSPPSAPPSPPASSPRQQP